MPMQTLPELALGPISIGFPVVQAALSGYSDGPMRILARRYGAAYTLCEVMLERFVREVKGTGRTQHHLRVTGEEHPVGGQLMGAEPEQFGPAAERLVASGFDVIDINFGCPVKSALGGCRGGFHLSRPDVALEIVRRVRDSVPPHIPVTVKMRRGIDDGLDSRRKFFRILDGVFDIGAAAVTVHARTVLQRYVGPSDWPFLREVKSHVGDRIVLGSGDLFTARACLDMIEQTGVDGVTVARGAIGNPWIFREARALAAGEPLPPPPTVREQRAALDEHFELSAEAYGDDRCVSTMRKFGIRYAARHPQYEEVRNAFATVRTAAEWDRVLDDWYALDASGRSDRYDSEANVTGSGR